LGLSDPPRSQTELTLEPSRISTTAPNLPGFDQILTPEALAFVSDLVQHFSSDITVLLGRRALVHEKMRTGTLPDFLEETREIRESSWSVASIPSDLRQRRVEITGPVDRKMVINALNSGADVYMADFEDSHSPTWIGTVQGQINLRDAVDGTITYTGPDGREYRLGEKLATLFVRPRGLHLKEKHVLYESKPVPASLFDYGLFLYHNAKKLISRGTGPYFYIPKLESHLEARLWNDIFDYSEEALNLPQGSIKCSVLIETILAAFEMDEILYELKERVTALNFGRWDYIFSVIKFLGHDPRFLLPERPLLTMTRGFLNASSQLLVQTCHKRSAYAIGGMAAQIPVRNDPHAQEALERVVVDKKRELSEGYEGAWVAHPGLVPVVMKIFDDSILPAQNDVSERESRITREDLLKVPEPEVSEKALRANTAVSLRYLESWLGGLGCVAINNLMEDTATVEICRAQIWQWVHHSARMTDRRVITNELFHALLEEERSRIESEIGPEAYRASNYRVATELLGTLVTRPDFPEFMTLLAYDHLG
jgi:malate synthase